MKIRFIMLTIALLGNAAEANELWLSAEEREEWVVRFEHESEGTDTSRVFFAHDNHVMGLSGYFPIADTEPQTILDWVNERKAAFGFASDEKLSVEASMPFFESFAASETEYTDAESGLAFRLNVTFDGTTNANVLTVIVDTREQIAIRGVVSGHQPPTDGFASSQPNLSEEDAWKAAEKSLGVSMAEHRGAKRVWNSVDWLLNRVAGEKELLWLLSGIDSNGSYRSLVVRDSDGSILFASDGLHYFDVMPMTVESYTQNGAAYWETESATGCTALSPSCTNPAFAASLFARDEMPFVLESWKNLSSASGGQYGYEWPWAGATRSPLASAVKDPTALVQRLFLVVGHSGTECNSMGTPCGNYTRIWMGPGDDAVDVYGHEYGHNLAEDLWDFIGGHPVFSESGSFEEFVADWVGIVSEDHRLRWLYPTSPNNRTNFVIQTPNSTMNWTAEGCNIVNPTSKRGALGRGMHIGWSALKTQPQARDVLFRAWRLTGQYAMFFTPQNFPTGADLVASMIALAPPPNVVTAPYPQPSVLMADAFISLGCF